MALPSPYDAVNAAIFLPTGGSRHLRQQLVDAVEARPGHRVLELGCGTGQVTARLLAAGASVVAVDELRAMLTEARRRAPAATFVEGDAIGAPVGDGYDRVVLSFVLHGFDAAGRTRLLRRAGDALHPAGLIGILEWARPAGRLHAALWRRFLDALEPAPELTRQVLPGALDADIAAADLRIESRRSTTAGRTQIIVARREAAWTTPMPRRP